MDEISRDDRHILEEWNTHSRGQSWYHRSPDQ